MQSGSVVEVAVPVPLDETFDYALEAGARAEPGVRVLVPHGGRRVVGVVIAVRGAGESLAPVRLRRVIQVLDEEPVLPATLLEAVLRAARDALCPPGIALA